MSVFVVVQSIPCLLGNKKIKNADVLQCKKLRDIAMINICGIQKDWDFE